MSSVKGVPMWETSFSQSSQSSVPDSSPVDSASKVVVHFLTPSIFWMIIKISERIGVESSDQSEKNGSILGVFQRSECRKKASNGTLSGRVPPPEVYPLLRANREASKGKVFSKICSRCMGASG
ncbi:hypothetical protein OPQ81_005870 [Rhizoctonia solani]|nr:hypothetical protein OPQ81_005870 [Rhizoctonia solani]